MTTLARKKKILLSALFALTFLIGLGATFLVAKNSAAESVLSINVSSSHKSYANNEQGSWNVKKSAKIIDTENAELELELHSIMKGNGKAKDILIMLDTSGSMTQARVSQTQTAVRGLAQDMLNDVDDNRIAVAAFNDEAYSVTSGFMTDAMMLGLEMGDYMPAARGGTNYYKAFKKIEEYFADYESSNARDALVVFITDGAPIEDHPLEVAEYQNFKHNYPFVTVQGLQYEIGDTVIPQIAAVSDNQFVSDSTNFEDTLFEAAMDGYKYDQFIITDTINNEYYEIDSADANFGTVSVSGATVTWDLGNQYRSGLRHKLSVALKVKVACLTKDDARCPVNQSMNIKSKLTDTPDENVTTVETPILQFKYDVSYELNAPAGCENAGALPEVSKEIVSSSQQISTVEPVCSGYRFNGWTIATDGVRRYNDDYFTMPDKDVVLRALWSKLSISKSMDGTIKPTTIATFRPAQFDDYNNSLNGYGVSYSAVAGDLSSIRAIKVSDGPINPDYDYSRPNITFHDASSELPIYGDFDSTTGTFYFFSDADEIHLNQYADGAFSRMTNLVDISGLAELKTDNLTSLYRAFAWDYNLTNLSPIADWDVDQVTNMSGIFENLNKITTYAALSRWQTGENTNLYHAFYENYRLTGVDGIKDWNVEKVTNMSGIFAEDSALVDISGLSKWNTRSVTDLSSAFANARAVTSISGLSTWKTENVTTLFSTFSGMSSLTSLEGLEEWDVKKVTSMYSTFSVDTMITSLEPLSNWKTLALTDMTTTFNFDTGLTSLHGLEQWDTSKVTSFYSTFSYDSNLSNIEALADWNVGEVINMHEMFWRNGVTTLHGLEDWRPVKAQDMSGLFGECSSLANISALSDWRPVAVTDITNILRGTAIVNLTALSGWMQWPDGVTPTLKSMTRAFANCAGLTSLSGLDNWDISAVTGLAYLFEYDTALANITALADWQPSAVTTMEGTFSGCRSITSIAVLSGWGRYTGNLANMQSTFSTCTSLNNISGLSTWNTSSLWSLSSAFYGDSAITDISALTRGTRAGADYESWNTGALSSIYGVFYGCSGITSIEPLRNWDESNISDIRRSFYGTSVASLEPLSGWFNDHSVGKLTYTFYGTKASSLNGLQNWQTSGLSDLEGTFGDMSNLANISALQNWTTSRVGDITKLFTNDVLLDDISPVAGWNLESVYYTSYAFENCSSLTDLSQIDAWGTTLQTSSINHNMFDGVPTTAGRPSWWTY